MLCSMALFLLRSTAISFFVLPTWANTFIWDPSSGPSNGDAWKRPYAAFSNPPICVNIPANLSLCYGIKYSQMRLPNLLHHDTLNEVIEQSESWIQLTKIKCHEDTQLFLCSLFTPVCLDQTIPPCRSLCELVQRGCEPFMLKHGYSWPSIMRCDQFPVDNNMCIQSQGNSMEPTPPPSPLPPMLLPSQPPTNTLSSRRKTQEERFYARNKTVTNADSNEAFKEDEKLYKNLIDVICQSDWVIKSGLNPPRNGQIRIKKYKVIYGNLSPHLRPSFTVMVNRSSIITAGSTGSSSSSNNKRREKFVLIGKGNGDNLSVKLMISWQRNTPQIKKAIRTAKSGNGCRRMGLPVPGHVGTKTGAKRRQQSNRRQRQNRRS